MRIELVIEESGEVIAEDGTTFMEAAGRMILTLDGLFGGEPDASIFEAFSALASGEREFTSRDFSTPESNFTLRVLGSPDAPTGGLRNDIDPATSEPMEPGEPEPDTEEQVERVVSDWELPESKARSLIDTLLS